MSFHFLSLMHFSCICSLFFRRCVSSLGVFLLSSMTLRISTSSFDISSISFAVAVSSASSSSFSFSFTTRQNQPLRPNECTARETLHQSVLFRSHFQSALLDESQDFSIFGRQIFAHFCCCRRHHARFIIFVLDLARVAAGMEHDRTCLSDLAKGQTKKTQEIHAGPHEGTTSSMLLETQDRNIDGGSHISNAACCTVNDSGTCAPTKELSRCGVRDTCAPLQWTHA